MRWEGRHKRSGAEEGECVVAVEKNPEKVKLGGQRRKFRRRGGQ